jgi:hypothetical protein
MPFNHPTNQESIMAIESTSGEIAPFADVLASINRGALADEAASLLANLVQEVSHVGRKGVLTLKINVEPFTGGGDTIRVSGHVNVTPPSRDPHAGVFFYDEAGKLDRNDPRMNTLFDADKD